MAGNALSGLVIFKIFWGSMPRDPPRNVCGEFILRQDESSITCERIAQHSPFVCGLWLCLLFWLGLFNDMVIYMAIFEEAMSCSVTFNLNCVLVMFDHNSISRENSNPT
jgi:hypothetical protein